MKTLRDSFCLFIMSHQRPDRIRTIPSLKKAGYTGDLYIVVDDKDPMLDQYKDRFPDRLLVFNKDEVEENFDRGDNFEDQQAALWPRMACWEFAEQLGYQWFIEFDDDYEWFGHRIDPDGNYSDGIPTTNMDAVIESFIEYMQDAPIHSIAFSQGGDWIGGEGTTHGGVTTKRKAMNSFLCNTERPFKWTGRHNEDVSTYTTEGRRGKIFLTYMPMFLSQERTQATEGGMTEAYLKDGTYVKSFYTIMHCPSSVTITEMGTANPRLHHQVSWRHTVPKILPPEYQKPRDS